MIAPHQCHRDTEEAGTTGEAAALDKDEQLAVLDAVLEQAPAGSNFFHTFHLNGTEVHEIYKVNADRTVSIVSRSMAND